MIVVVFIFLEMWWLAALQCLHRLQNCKPPRPGPDGRIPVVLSHSRSVSMPWLLSTSYTWLSMHEVSRHQLRDVPNHVLHKRSPRGAARNLSHRSYWPPLSLRS